MQSAIEWATSLLHAALSLTLAAFLTVTSAAGSTAATLVPVHYDPFVDPIKGPSLVIDGDTLFVAGERTRARLT